MRPAIAGVAVLICSVASWADDGHVVLSEKGKPRATIIVSSSAIPAEKTAAAELARHLKLVTGADFPVIPEVDRMRQGTRIFVGQSAAVRRMLPDVDFGKLGRDAIVVRRVGNDLVLVGDRPRGTLYAVYTFLEDAVGCRWWTAQASDMPGKPSLRARVNNVTYAPPFVCREAFEKSVIGQNPEFAARLKLNGHHQIIPQEFGGHYSILGWCHTFYQLIPPAKYFADHPEWFSEINGKRTSDRVQLCLTNEAMRRELTRNALAWVEKNPEAGIVSISQNDHGGPCQCAKCRAIAEAEGSESGPLVRFVNAVAEDIEKKYPGFLVETLAYQYTRVPPRQVKARRNVVIRFCSIECDFSRPITAPENARFHADLTAWKSVAQRLYVWDYLMNLENLLMPRPNWRVLGPNVRTFAKNNVMSLFEQGDGYNPDANFAPLRTWLMGHLMWDPNANESELMDQFLTGYYGPAGKHLREFIDLTCDAVGEPGRKLPIFTKQYGFLTPEVLGRASAIFDAAEKAVQGDEELLKRVRLQRLALDHAIVAHSPVPGLPVGKDLEQILDRFLTLSDGTGNNFRQEQFVMSPEYRDQLRAKVAQSKQ